MRKYPPEGGAPVSAGTVWGRKYFIFAPAGGLPKIFLLLLAVSTVAALFSLYQVLTY
ncbi:hypothetical protein LTSESEN_1163 [Salmonella enterica subsp. enterica serovar Senftenberg str. A4-543]|uniref:Uncharacterized protein n=1 Tax=Salmonella enterica subsp. enterica serovar Senftenberg str. A4-543 TaxID=913082 RepID=G5QWQ4_SALSE|nr:hypothetical protein LTSESEN_1163 [Salmonella enterica subsp. enterica serovar Senftenberg str. A4-543]